MSRLKFYQTQGKAYFRCGVASYGTSTTFFDAIYAACDLRSAMGPEVRLLDAMAGPGKLGLAIKERYAQEGIRGQELILSFNDGRAEALSALSASGFTTVACDVREIGMHVTGMDRVTVRYAIKDLPEGEAEAALSAIREVLVPGGKVILGEMTADSVEAQRGIIEVHGAKQVLAGRDIRSDGSCFIPMLEQWVQYAQNAGLVNVQVTYRGYSDVVVGDWKGQFSKGADDEEMIMQMRKVVRSTAQANAVFRNETRTHHDVTGEWHVSFPILVLTAEKRA